MELMREKIRKVTTNNGYVGDNRLLKCFKSKYNVQAIDFLLENETTCDIVSIGKSIPTWNSKLHATYRVTLENKKGSYTFTFYDSLKNTEENKLSTMDFYSVLACMDNYCPDSFDDFCSEYGYTFNNESEYIKTKSIHLSLIEQSKKLESMFTEDQLSKLSEIN